MIAQATFNGPDVGWFALSPLLVLVGAATGLLLVLVGRATRAQRFLMELPKAYFTRAGWR